MYSSCKLEGDGCIMEKKRLWRFFKKGMKSLKMQLNDWIHKRTKLMIAVRDLDEERVRKLLRKMDVNEVDKDGNTALMYMPNGCVGKNKRAKNMLVRSELLEYINLIQSSFIIILSNLWGQFYRR